MRKPKRYFYRNKYRDQGEAAAPWIVALIVLAIVLAVLKWLFPGLPL